MDLAMKTGAPVIGLNDSGGGRIQEGVGVTIYYISSVSHSSKKLPFDFHIFDWDASFLPGIGKSGMAENWIYMGEEKGEQYWYNPQSVKKVDKGIFKLWLKSVRSKRSKYETARRMQDEKEYANAVLNSTYERIEIGINCTALKWDYLSYVFYGKDGKELFKQRYAENQQRVGQGDGWDIERGDLFNILVEKVCP